MFGGFDSDVFKKGQQLRYERVNGHGQHIESLVRPFVASGISECRSLRLRELVGDHQLG